MQPSPEYVLDSTALVAVINGEPGAEAIAPLMPFAVISAVNFAEAVYWLRKGGMPAKSITETLTPLLTSKPVPFDENLAYVSSSICERAEGRELSFGDCACLALAVSRKATVVTTETDWEQLGLKLKVMVIGERNGMEPGNQPVSTELSDAEERPDAEIPYEPS
jgi:ribonuclease VapC